MKTTIIKDKHLRLDQRKIELVKKILRTKTETEAIEKALELVITRDTDASERKEIMKRILERRNSLIVKGDVAEWIREGREERERVYDS
ncbi:MAG: hypothetical protein A3K22_03005 [Deltaproteobacteria bacterium RBG_16_42_7]|nr:MAG: hypothetical protein A3K22_03005 [Deltaproteobacteria bacterium RBG_16_42_7]